MSRKEIEQTAYQQALRLDFHVLKEKTSCEKANATSRKTSGVWSRVGFVFLG
jgi:hypothetical protein